MDVDVARALVSDAGTAALDAAAAERDPGSLAAAERLRRTFPADLAAAALGQVALRRKAVGKLGERAHELLLTPDGLEQATRADVTAWRAARLIELGARAVYDLGCGIGADARGLAQAGLDVVAVELDPATATLAERNLRGLAPVVAADATTVDLPEGAAVYLDPARRDARGRTWDPARLSPSWDFVTATLASGRLVCVKAGPGLPHALIPDGVLAEWVSHRGDVVECSLWAAPVLAPGRAAALIRDGETHRLVASGARPTDVAVGAPGAWLAEPDGAAIRAGAVPDLAADAGAWVLDAHVAYLSADRPWSSPWLTWFEVTDVLPYDEKALRRLVRERGVGTLEIKKRGIDVDPAALRKKLKPSGPHAATLVLTPTPGGARAVVCRRV